jgi:hypothetical protein
MYPFDMLFYMADKKLLFNLPVLITKQGRRFVVYTPALDISTSGKSEKEAKTRFGELVNLFLDEVMEKDTAGDVLFELGWTKVKRTWTPPKMISAKSVGFKMPAFA